MGFGRMKLLRCACATAAIDFAAACADASAVGTFMTRTASFSRIFEQRLERGDVARGIGVAGDVDGVRARPDRRQRRIELLHGLRRNAGESAAKIDEPIHGQHADPAAVGEDRQPLARKRPHPPERLGRGKQLVEIEHPQQAGAAKRGVVDRIGTGERAGMRLRRLGALRMAAGLDHHHRLDPSGGARRRHELARVVDRFDVKKNRAGRAIEREEVEQVAEIDVDLVSERHDCRKTDAMRRRPFDQACGDGAGLRDEGEIAGRRHARGETGIELGARRQHAETVWADQSAGRWHAPPSRRHRRANLLRAQARR